VVESYPERFQIATLAAGNNAELVFEASGALESLA